MVYTKHGLRITFEELEKLLENARNEARFHNMEGCIYIKGGEKPQITQYCSYHECNPTNHTYLVKTEL